MDYVMQIKYLLIALGTIGILDTLALFIIGSSINAWNLLPAGIGIIFILLAFRRQRFKMFLAKNQKLRAGLIIVSALWVVSFIAIEYTIVANAQSDFNLKTDFLIILGSGIRGEQVSPTLKERIDEGIRYLKDYLDVPVVVSGGRGFGESITEAEAMRRYLIKNGIADNRILKEEQSTSTMENFIYTKALLLNKTNKRKISLMIITNDFHMLRSKMLARRNGFEAYGLSCRTPYHVMLTTYIREYFALIKSYFFDSDI